MEVRTLVRFRDLKVGGIREVGEIFPCTEDRYQEILEKGNYVEVLALEEIEEPEEDQEEVEEPVKAAPKTRRKNKKDVG